MINQKGVEVATKNLLIALGVDLEDPNFKDTPARVGRSYNQILGGLNDDNGKASEAILSRTFPSDNDQMVVVKDIKTFSMCPHHLLPVEVTAHVAYVPNGKVLGLSKLARAVELFARQPMLQEDLANNIATAIQKHLNPLGVGVVIEGKHFCMVMRGVEKRESMTITSKMVGCFRNPEEKARDEFLAFIKL